MKFRKTEVGKIFNEWNLIELGEVADVIDPHPSHRAPKATNKGLPFAGIGDIDEYGNVDFNKARIVSEEVIEEHIRNYKVDDNSIGYGRVGTVGKVVKLKNRSDYKYALAPTLAVINPNEKIEPKFLYGVLKSDMFFNQVFKYMTGSTRPSIGIQVLRKIKIPYPSMIEQNRIAHVLNALGEKIELNNEMNKTLEEMAQALFKRWFVDFEFPNENEEPYKSSGGEMVESEMGMIPKGWNVKNIGSLGTVITGKTPSTKQEENYGTEYNFITPVDINGKSYIVNSERKLSNIGYEKVKNLLICSNSIGVTCIGSNLGEVYINAKDSFTNQQINSLVLNNVNIYPYIYIYLKGMKNEFLNMAGGSAVPIINKTTFSEIKLVMPKDQVLNEYCSRIECLFEKIKSNLIENFKSIELRDLLLAKLMSGEIRVLDIDEANL